jgi:hypothetical protein
MPARATPCMVTAPFAGRPESSTARERRLATRHHVRWHVAVVDARARTLADGRITDVSLCGARIEDLPLGDFDWGGESPLAPDSIVWLAIHTVPRLIRARVVWRHSKAVGLFFQDVPPPADLRLRELIPSD